MPLSCDNTGVPRRGLFLDCVLHGSPASMSESLSLGRGALVASITVDSESMTVACNMQGDGECGRAAGSVARRPLFVCGG